MLSSSLRPLLRRHVATSLRRPTVKLLTTTTTTSSSGEPLKTWNAVDVEVKIGAIQRQIREELGKHDFDSAVEACVELRDLVEHAYEEKANPILAACHNNLGLAQKGKGNFEEAARSLAKAVQVYEESGLKAHPSTATALHNMGVCYKEQAQHRDTPALGRTELLETAAECLNESLTRRRELDFSKNFDKDANDLGIASTRVVLASILRLQKRNADADEEVARAVDALRRAYDAAVELPPPKGGGGGAVRKKTQDVATALATALNNQAYFQKLDGRFVEAQENYESALALRTEYLGPDHPHTIATLHNLAELYHAHGHADKAKDLREDILARLRAQEDRTREQHEALQRGEIRLPAPPLHD